MEYCISGNKSVFLLVGVVKANGSDTKYELLELKIFKEVVLVQIERCLKKKHSASYFAAYEAAQLLNSVHIPLLSLSTAESFSNWHVSFSFGFGSNRLPVHCCSELVRVLGCSQPVKEVGSS